MEIIQRSHIQMLSKEVANQLRVFHRLWRMRDTGCLDTLRLENRCVIPYAPFTFSRLHTGTREAGSYNHHSQLAKFKGRYYLSWHNGIVHENAAGQRILLSSSDDARNWSEPICVAGGPEESSTVYYCDGLHATNDALLLSIMSEDATGGGTDSDVRRGDPATSVTHVYSSPNGSAWRKVRSFDKEIHRISEAPKPTAEGRLLCVCLTLSGGPGMLLWPGSDACETPEVVNVPAPEGASFPYAEGSWYQTDSGRIVAFWRDEGESCRLYVNYSDDGGRTFVAPMISDIPDSMSRVHAGRLLDGRYYLCSNAFPSLLDRMHLMLLLSDDGCTFNKVYTLIDDPTTQRLAGLLKVDGYQYPSCLSEEGRLLVAYSVNKEDIECGIVNLAGP